MNTPPKRGKGRPTSFGPEAVALAESGATLAEIARHFGVGFRAVCTDWTRRYPNFKAAVERGRLLAAERRRIEAAAKAEAKQAAKHAARADALKTALRDAGLMPAMPMPVVTPEHEPERPPARPTITSTGYRQPGAPRWHERQRAKRSDDGSEPTATPHREPRRVRELAAWRETENGDGEPFEMLDPRRDW